MLKSFLMASFCGDTQTSDTSDDTSNTQLQTSASLPMTPIQKLLHKLPTTPTSLLHFLAFGACPMPCTSAVNCGISSINCTTCFCVGPPLSWHEMVHEMGCVDRLHNSAHGTNMYNIFLNVNTFISLWLRVHCESNVSVRDRQHDTLFQILGMLILPQQCYHAMVEQHFERPSTYNGDQTCNNNCLYCDRSYQSFCGHE